MDLSFVTTPWELGFNVLRRFCFGRQFDHHCPWTGKVGEALNSTSSSKRRAPPWCAAGVLIYCWPYVCMYAIHIPRTRLYIYHITHTLSRFVKPRLLRSKEGAIKHPIFGKSSLRDLFLTPFFFWHMTAFLLWEVSSFGNRPGGGSVTYTVVNFSIESTDRASQLRWSTFLAPTVTTVEPRPRLLPRLEPHSQRLSATLW